MTNAKKIFRFQFSFWEDCQELSVFEVPAHGQLFGGEHCFTREEGARSREALILQAVKDFFGLSSEDEADALIEKGQESSLFRENAAEELHGSFGDKEVFFLEI